MFWPKIPPFWSKKSKYTSILLWKQYICAVLNSHWAEKSFKSLQGPLLAKEWLKMAKIGDFTRKNTNFQWRKHKKFPMVCKKLIKTLPYIYWDHIRMNEVKYQSFMAEIGQFLHPAIFRPLYICIQNGKKRKSTLYLKTSQNFLRL